MNGETFTMLVLVPHRDVEAALRPYRQRLFAAGFAGAYAVPCAAPLALLAAPLPASALQEGAAFLRAASVRQGRDGKVRCGGLQRLAVPGILGGTAAVFGFALDIPVPEPPRLCAGRVLYRFPEAVLAMALAVGGEGEGLAPPLPPPECSFRAGALATMRFRVSACAESAYRFDWALGPLFWLPAYRRQRGKNVSHTG